jgi:hypothetical protein
VLFQRIRSSRDMRGENHLSPDGLSLRTERHRPATTLGRLPNKILTISPRDPFLKSPHPIPMYPHGAMPRRADSVVQSVHQKAPPFPAMNHMRGCDSNDQADSPTAYAVSSFRHPIPMCRSGLFRQRSPRRGLFSRADCQKPRHGLASGRGAGSRFAPPIPDRSTSTYHRGIRDV